MAAPPIAYRAESNKQQYTPSFPPTVYYRDTFGLVPTDERKHHRINLETGSSTDASEEEDSIATKSTVKTTLNVNHNPQQGNSLRNNYRMIKNRHLLGNLMNDSQNTESNLSNHEVEQIITNQIIIVHAKSLLWLTVCAFGIALQLLIFATICVFFDGCPYYVSIVSSVWFMLNAILVYIFLRRKHSRSMLILCCITTSVSFIVCVILFFWTAYLIYGEDEIIRADNFDFSKAELDRSNHILRNARMAMYTLKLIYTPLEAVCIVAILYILCKNQRLVVDDQITRGYFFSKPSKHQTVLVPITLKQVRRVEAMDQDTESVSMAVQTNGTH